MRHSIFPFGQTIEGYSAPVLNERAVRAAAGILFLFAIITFMIALLQGDFAPTRLFIVVFLIDFTIRLFVSPKFSPSLIMGQWLVCKQAPEYTGAAQKAFAWAIGFGLVVMMFYLMVINHSMGPLNMMICGACLIFMWFETSAGICIGCKVYNLFAKDPAQLCPGDTCVYQAPKGAGGSWVQGLIVVALFIGVFFLGKYFLNPVLTNVSGNSDSDNRATLSISTSEQLRCTVPEFAIKMGHEALWKKHNNC